MKLPERILLEHGGGGLWSHKLVTECFLPLFRNNLLERLDDGAVFTVGEHKLCFTTDSYVVDPLFFPGAILALSPFMARLTILPSAGEASRDQHGLYH